MLTTNESVKKYLLNFQKKSIQEILETNSLKYLLSDFFPLNQIDLKVQDFNRMFFFIKQKALINICCELERCGIKYITFKGIVLSNYLYQDSKDRSVGDLDIYMSPNDFDNALKILFKLGYCPVDNATILNKHHVVLNNNRVVVELHRHIINPRIGINESYLLYHIRKFKISGSEITTFDITSTFLHLLYHLYMDTYLAYGRLYQIIISKNLPQADRFLFRAYEIALFSEKYFDEINWEEIENDLKSQELKIFFKIMIFDILEIFPEVFPHSFVKTVNELKYVEDNREHPYKKLVQFDVNNTNIFNVLRSKYINDNWELRRDTNICKKVGEKISLIKKTSNVINRDLSCDINTEKTKYGLKICFKVSNDDFYISDMKNYDTQASDGVHLILCGTEQYSYNSVFFFPKRINDEIKIVVCDFLSDTNDVIEDNLIKADFLKTENDYTITAILSNKFLKENHLNSYLYMGLVISDCSRETHQRKNQLILSEKSSEWYNPIYFARIDIK